MQSPSFEEISPKKVFLTVIISLWAQWLRVTIQFRQRKCFWKMRQMLVSWDVTFKAKRLRMQNLSFAEISQKKGFLTGIITLRATNQFRQR